MFLSGEYISLSLTCHAHGEFFLRTKDTSIALGNHWSKFRT